MLYEERRYAVQVGKMPEVIRLYREEGYPALEAGGFHRRLVGYFVSDVGRLHELVHLWRFEDDADRRAHLAGVFGDEAFMRFAVQLRPLLVHQENKLLSPAPWGPNP